MVLLLPALKSVYVVVALLHCRYLANIHRHTPEWSEVVA